MQSRVLSAKLFAFVIIEFASQPGVEPDLGSAAGILRVSASGLSDARLETMPLHFHRGIGPDEAAVIATYLNPALRSPRTRSRADRAGGRTAESRRLPTATIMSWVGTHWNDERLQFYPGWEVTSLLPLLPKHTGARRAQSNGA